MKTLARALGLALCFAAPGLHAEEVNIQKDLPSVTVQTQSGPVDIKRIQDNANQLTGEWALTSRPCPPFCIQPMQVAEGVTTIGELELLEMAGQGESHSLGGRRRIVAGGAGLLLQADEAWPQRPA